MDGCAVLQQVHAKQSEFEEDAYGLPRVCMELNALAPVAVIPPRYLRGIWRGLLFRSPVHHLDRLSLISHSLSQLHKIQPGFTGGVTTRAEAGAGSPSIAHVGIIQLTGLAIIAPHSPHPPPPPGCDSHWRINQGGGESLGSAADQYGSTGCFPSR